jgi:hypothetical protein
MRMQLRLRDAAGRPLLDERRGLTVNFRTEDGSSRTDA